MALFGTKKEEKAPEVTTVAENNPAEVSVNPADDVLLRPHITEKAYALSKDNVYTFTIAPYANKYMVSEAITNTYKVTPVRVNIVKKRPRLINSLMRKKASKQTGLKKAYVYLKEGDTISYI